jgi:tetratricopeptide (TPR) repeat protein
MIVLLLVAAAPSRTWETLLEEGHRAFARGDFLTAADRYEEAEVRSPEPGRVAYFLAGAKYHLALKAEGPSPELQEAEQWYRCCTEPGDPHRARALFGLGNCLLHKAGQRDAASLFAAIACYDQCLSCAGEDPTLVKDALHNRERALLLALQFPPPASGLSPDKPPQEEPNPMSPHPHRPPLPVQVGDAAQDGTADHRSGANPVKPDQGTAPTRSSEKPPPGKGNLDPIPDEVEVPPLSVHDAAQHLAQAAQRVIEERQTYRQRSRGPTARGVQDW